MDRRILKYSEKHSVVVEFGEKFIQQVFDGSIDIFFSIYEMKIKGTRPFERKIQSILDVLSDMPLDKIKHLTKLISFCAASIELCFLERHKEYRILIELPEEDEQRADLNEAAKDLRQEIMGREGMFFSISKYNMDLYDDVEHYCVVHQELFDKLGEQNSIAKKIPQYYLERPAIMNFWKAFVEEVYDYAISLWQCILDGEIEISSLREILVLLSQDQRKSLKELAKSIIKDSVLRMVGIFEGCNYWLVTQYEGKYIHISYTDPDDEDHERNELAFDMHDEDECGIINLFSRYGLIS